MVRAGPLLLRLGRFPLRDQPAVVPGRGPLADRRLGWADPGQGAGRLAGRAPGCAAARPEFRQVAPGIRFGARWVRRQLHVQVVEAPAVLHSCQELNGKLVIDVEVTTATAPSSPQLVLAWPKGAAARHFPATASREDGRRLLVRGEV